MRFPCVCKRECTVCGARQPISPLLLSSFCYQLFGCIVLPAGRMFKQSPASQRADGGVLRCPSPPSSAITPRAQRLRSDSNICCATVKTAHTVLHDRERGGELSVCLFVHLEVVCFTKHHSVTVSGDVGFGHDRGTTGVKPAKLLGFTRIVLIIQPQSYDPSIKAVIS